MFAMKRIEKSEINAKNRLVNIKTERDILTKTYGIPWLISLFYSFQDDNFFYLVMEVNMSKNVQFFLD